MIKTSEYVSPGHPDKMCDYISSYILDRLLEADPQTRFALEVQAKANTVNLAGEIATRAFPGDFERLILGWTREAVSAIGYTAAYNCRWKGHAISTDTLKVHQFVSRQSPEIAEGLVAGGWGDQGIFFGLATGEKEFDFMPRDIFLARRLGFDLYLLARQGALPIGLDIKTQISIDTVTSEVVDVIVAAPVWPDDRDNALDKIQRLSDRMIQTATGQQVTPVVRFNGTGSYLIHSTIADAGTTGRKLAVDFYGGNCPIGGGSPWTKDGSKADLALNLYARHLATQACFAGNANPGAPVFSSISCAIGKREIRCGLYEGFDGRTIAEWTEDRPASEIIDLLHLREPVFTYKFIHGLFKLPRLKAAQTNILGEI